MSDNENKESNTENKQADEKTKEEKKQEQEEQELLKIIEEMRKISEQKKQEKKPKRNKLLAIEFGGVFHHNLFVNFVFSFLLNVTLAFLVIQVFQFASYRDIIYMVLLLLIYSLIEEVFRLYVLLHHFPLILKSFGTIFYFGYVLIFYLLDQYVFIDTFDFINGTLLVFFVLIFTLLRYFIGVNIRQYFRKNNMR
jgi:hypothetical protein